MNKYSKVDKKEINQLVKQIGCGNEDAFDLLYNKMKNVIYYFLLKEEATKEAIEEVISSTFLVVIEKSRSKMIYKNCFSWILTIAKFQLYNYNRKQDKVAFEDESVDRCHTEINIGALSLKHEVEKLDIQSQQVLYFSFCTNLSQFEIAKTLKVSISTIKRRKNDILNHFKEIYSDEKH